MATRSRPGIVGQHRLGPVASPAHRAAQLARGLRRARHIRDRSSPSCRTRRRHRAWSRAPASAGRPSIRASSFFCTQTPCPFTQRCSRAPSHSAKAARGSIAFTMTRLWSTRQADAVGRGGKRGLDRAGVADGPVEGEVAGRFGVDRRAARGADPARRAGLLSRARSGRPHPARRRGVSATTIATASPTKRIRSARQNRALGRRARAAVAVGDGRCPSCPAARPPPADRPPSAPDARRAAARAAVTSSAVIRAWATVERRNSAWSAPSGAMSST